jgi:hypothetical protein
MRLKSFTLIILAFSVAYIANSQATKEDITGNRSEQQVVPYKLHDADKTGEYARHQHFNRMLSSHDREIATNNIGQRNIIAEECDTLHYPLAGTPTLFFVTDDGGYVCGNNIYGDLAKADLFEPQDTGRLLYKGFFEFAYVTMGSGQDPNIDFRVWDNTGTDDLPGNVIGSATVPLSQILDDVSNGLITEIAFDPPVYINTPFYLGVMLPALEGDTLALISTDEDEISPGIAYEMWSDQTWFAFSDASSWGLNLGQGIYAQYCEQGFGVGDDTKAPAVLIYPNPVKNVLHIKINSHEPVTIAMLSFLGQQAGKWSVEDARNITLPVYNLSPGMYLVTITGKNYRVSRKIVIQ